MVGRWGVAGHREPLCVLINAWPKGDKTIDFTPGFMDGPNIADGFGLKDGRWVGCGQPL